MKVRPALALAWALGLSLPAAAEGEPDLIPGKGLLSLSALALLDASTLPRGGGIEVGLAFGELPLQPSLSLALSWDGGLSLLALEGILSLRLDEGFRLWTSTILPLSEARLEVDGGRFLRLAPSAWPTAFGLEARLGGFALPWGEEEPGEPSLELVASLGYRAWSSEGRPGSDGRRLRGDALAVFVSGVTAGLGGRLLLPLPPGDPREGEEGDGGSVEAPGGDPIYSRHGKR